MDDVFIFVLMILFAFVLPIVFTAMWWQHKKDMAKMNVELNSSEKQNIENELAAVKTRLEVLEAIVTDKKYQLNEEIGQLSKDEGRLN